MDEYLQRMLVTDPLREPVVVSIIDALDLPPGSNGLDVGCGIGTQAAMLAESLGTDGHVTGLDNAPELLEYARDEMAARSLTERVSFVQGDMGRLPFDNDSFEWAWSMDCVGYAPVEPVPLLTEMARVVKPGGSVAIAFWSSQKLLAGYPRLEALLDATPSGLAPFTEDMSPEQHSLRALGWFDAAGIMESTVRTFAGSVQGPLSDDIRQAMTDILEMRWQPEESQLSVEDWKEYQRLTTPESDDFILNLPDYHALFTYSLFTGIVVT